MGRNDGNTIRSVTKSRQRKDRKDLTQKNSKSYKASNGNQPCNEKKPVKSKKKRVAKERDARAAAKKADLHDGADKGRIHAEGSEYEIKPLPASNKDSITEASEPHFIPGGYSDKLYKKGEMTKKTPSANPFQEMHLSKAKKKGELSSLPKDPKNPEDRRKFVAAIKKAPTESDYAKRYIAPSAQAK